ELVARHHRLAGGGRAVYRRAGHVHVSGHLTARLGELQQNDPLALVLFADPLADPVSRHVDRRGLGAGVDAQLAVTSANTPSISRFSTVIVSLLFVPALRSHGVVRTGGAGRAPRHTDTARLPTTPGHRGLGSWPGSGHVDRS